MDNWRLTIGVAGALDPLCRGSIATSYTNAYIHSGPQPYQNTNAYIHANHDAYAHYDAYANDYAYANRYPNPHADLDAGRCLPSRRGDAAGACGNRDCGHREGSGSRHRGSNPNVHAIPDGIPYRTTANGYANHNALTNTVAVNPPDGYTNGGDQMISVILPAHNEGKRLPMRAPILLDWLPRDGEVIIVDNGSTDNTLDVAKQLAALDERVIYLHLDERGKGLAVRRGMEIARGDICLYADVDLSTPTAEWPRLLQAIANGADVAIASRRVPGALVYGLSWQRRLMSRVFASLVHHHFPELAQIKDTQCGFKAFTRPAADAIFPLVTIDGMAFDVQVLSLAAQMGLQIAEVGVYWHHHGDSRVTFWEPLIMYAELLEARRSTLVEAPA